MQNLVTFAIPILHYFGCVKMYVHGMQMYVNGSYLCEIYININRHTYMAQMNYIIRMIIMLLRPFDAHKHTHTHKLEIAQPT